ncbi:MAG: VOC family protein, partial [Xanthomonadales bacterium]|nr:VOC family protein [Xanthomonadales bacterium]
VSTLGLEEVSRLTDENGRYDIINLSRDGLFVELVQLRDAQARPEGRLEGPFKVGFLVADLDAFLAALPADRERPEVVEDQRNGLKMVQLRDPDGTVVQVMARQP